MKDRDMIKGTGATTGENTTIGGGTSFRDDKSMVSNRPRVPQVLNIGDIQETKSQINRSDMNSKSGLTGNSSNKVAQDIQDFYKARDNIYKHSTPNHH